MDFKNRVAGNEREVIRMRDTANYELWLYLKRDLLYKGSKLEQAKARINREFKAKAE